MTFDQILDFKNKRKAKKVSSSHFSAIIIFTYLLLLLKINGPVASLTPFFSFLTLSSFLSQNLILFNEFCRKKATVLQNSFNEILNIFYNKIKLALSMKA